MIYIESIPLKGIVQKLPYRSSQDNEIILTSASIPVKQIDHHAVTAISG